MSTEFKEFATEMISSANYNDLDIFMRFFEREGSCAGVCKPALFYWSKSIKEGIPTQSCLESLVEAIHVRLLALGIVSLFDSYFMFNVFVMQFFLWHTYSNQPEKIAEMKR